MDLGPGEHDPGDAVGGAGPLHAKGGHHGIVCRPRERGAAHHPGMRTEDLLTTPPDLPVPVDDGAADHLPGTAMPPIALHGTDGGDHRLDDPDGPPTIVFAYPRTGRPGEDPPGGLAEWNAIPGARGCTPQVCNYRDHHAEIAALGGRVYGLSTQDTAYQQEAADRLGIQYPLLSDERLELATALDLPRWDHLGTTLLKRHALLIRAGRIERVLTRSSRRTRTRRWRSPGYGSSWRARLPPRPDQPAAASAAASATSRSSTGSNRHIRRSHSASKPLASRLRAETPPGSAVTISQSALPAAACRTRSAMSARWMPCPRAGFGHRAAREQTRPAAEEQRGGADRPAALLGEEEPLPGGAGEVRRERPPRVGLGTRHPVGLDRDLGEGARLVRADRSDHDVVALGCVGDEAIDRRGIERGGGARDGVAPWRFVADQPTRGPGAEIERQDPVEQVRQQPQSERAIERGARGSTASPRPPARRRRAGAPGRPMRRGPSTA